MWEHSFTEADFTDWGDGFPTTEDNVADCAVMSQTQVQLMIFVYRLKKKDFNLAEQYVFFPFFINTPTVY